MNRKLLGNIFIIASLFILAFTYFPYLQLYLPRTSFETLASTTDTGISIDIPKINAQATIIPDVDPWNQAIYGPALQKGVAQAKGTALPGDKGTSFLFAHSSELPWKMTRQNTSFLRLGELQLGDLILIRRGGNEYKYTVESKQEVWPNEVQYLKQDQGDKLILQTCTPVGTALKRLLIFATLMTT